MVTAVDEIVLARIAAEGAGTGAGGTLVVGVVAGGGAGGAGTKLIGVSAVASLPPQPSKNSGTPSAQMAPDVNRRRLSRIVLIPLDSPTPL
jgi:hypothetical protein